jgi:hypothetical protein
VHGYGSYNPKDHVIKTKAPNKLDNPKAQKTKHDELENIIIRK